MSSGHQEHAATKELGEALNIAELSGGKPRTAVTTRKQGAGREGDGVGARRGRFLCEVRKPGFTVTLILGKVSPCFNAARDRAVGYLLVVPEGGQQSQRSPRPYGTGQISYFRGDISVGFSSVFVLPLCVLCSADSS